MDLRTQVAAKGLFTHTPNDRDKRDKEVWMRLLGKPIYRRELPSSCELFGYTYPRLYMRETDWEEAYLYFGDFARAFLEEMHLDEDCWQKLEKSKPQDPGRGPIRRYLPALTLLDRFARHGKPAIPPPLHPLDDDKKFEQLVHLLLEMRAGYVRQEALGDPTARRGRMVVAIAAQTLYEQHGDLEQPPVPGETTLLDMAKADIRSMGRAEREALAEECAHRRPKNKSLPIPPKTKIYECECMEYLCDCDFDIPCDCKGPCSSDCVEAKRAEVWERRFGDGED